MEIVIILWALGYILDKAFGITGGQVTKDPSYDDAHIVE